jgi:nicotinamidase-related amidase
MWPRFRFNFEINMKDTLLIIDVQKFFINKFTKDIPKKIANFIESHKFDFVLFLKFVNSKNSGFVKYLNWRKMFSSPDTDIVPELKRFTTKRNIFEKTAFSAFKSKGFLQFLKENQIKRLYICGFDTDGCVFSTAIEAFDLGFDVKVIQDLCASHHGKEYHKNAIKLLKRNAKNLIINSRKLNIVKGLKPDLSLYKKNN